MKINKRSFYNAIKLFTFTSALLLPRIALSYPIYVLSTSLVGLSSIRAFLGVFLFTIVTMFSVLTLLVVGFKVSITGYFLAIALLMPLIVVLSGGKIKLKLFDARKAIDFINIGTLFSSIVSMALFYGFPFKLPYIHYLPDAYGAFYGLGGAKIVTVIGFFGLLNILANGSDRHSNKIVKWLLVVACLCNFIVPSYLIGTACGLLALGVPLLRSKLTLLVMVCISYFVGVYMLERLETINSGFYDIFGFHPKVASYVALKELYIGEPITFITGTGLGQFNSTVATWSSSYSLDAGGFGSLPGFFMSEFHNDYMGKYLSLVFENRWFLNSSLNQPYSTISSLLAELGLIVGVSFLLILFYRLICNSLRLDIKITLVTFIISMFLIDVWHDSPWFSVMILLFLSTASQRPDVLEEVK